MASAPAAARGAARASAAMVAPPPAGMTAEEALPPRRCTRPRPPFGRLPQLVRRARVRAVP